MGKLNIAHHKSYHPYRLDNIERVRKDEEEARLKEEREEGRMRLADSEARIQLLRERSSTNKKSKKREEQEAEAELLAQATAPRIANNATNGGKHINFFEDLEQNVISAAIQRSREVDKIVKGKGKAAETEKGIPLAPSEKDLKPWYSAKLTDSEKEVDNERRMKDLSHKSLSDPLTSINQQLASRYPTTNASRRSPPRMMAPPSVPSERDSRLRRESSERQRARELIERKRREMAGSETPSTVHGGYAYGNQFNKREVEEAHAMRDRGREQGRRRDARERTW